MYTALEPMVQADYLPSAIAFVDYEHWTVAQQKLFCMKPNIGEWFEDLHQKVKLRDVYFFGDFSAPSLENELYRIRSYSNKIIETKNAGYYKKDFTDFIMLDCIYQQVIQSPEVQAFVIFSGDAHFNAAAAFIKNICRKQVGLYGVRGALSGQLKNTVDWWVEVPSEAALFRTYYKMILSNIKHLEDRKDFSPKPTFHRTVQCTAEYNGVDQESIQAALKQMIALGYITQQEEYIGLHRTIPTIRVDWDAVRAAGLSCCVSAKA